MALATLSIDLEARLAKLQEGFSAAEREAEKRSARIAKSMEKIGDVAKTLGGIFAGVFTASTVTTWITNVAQGLNQINDAVDATGAGFEKISALDDLARRTGTPFETATSILIKFNAELAKATPGSGTERTLAAIGLQAEELRRLDPADALQKVAQALQGYADNGDKARIVQDLFGKSVKDAAPFLNDLAEAGTLVATTTREQAEAADLYLKNIARLQSSLENLSRTIFGSVVPALNAMLERFEKRGVVGTFADDVRIKLNQGLAQIASQRIGDNTNRLAELLKVPEADRSFYTRNEIARLRTEIRELQADAQAATGVVKRITNGGQDPIAQPPRSDKSFLFGNEGYGPAFVTPPVEPAKGPKAPSAADQLLKGGWMDDAQLEGFLAGNLAKQIDALERSFDQLDALEVRRLSDLDRFGEQLTTQTADINASLITDDRARGEAQIEVDRQVLQKRLDDLQLYGTERDTLQAALDANILARQQALTEQLKPEWQRMLESWSDTTRHMADSYDSLMEGVISRTEDALAKFVRTGKLSVRDLGDFVADAISRMFAQKATAKLFEFADFMFNGFTVGKANGGAFDRSGELTAFANGGVVGSPTYFGYEGGRRRGLMGEAGPEAIMPLARGADGKLGVRASAQASGPTFVFNIASGVTRTELAAMVPQMTAQIEGRLAMRSRRPGYTG